MPGRRLILIMVLLLLSLSVLSATRDVSRSRLPGTGPAATTTEADRPAARAPDAEREAAPSKDRERPVSLATLPSPAAVQARAGERVILSIRSEAPEILAVRDLGVQAPVGPGTGGVLDLIAGQPGHYPITLALSGRRVGELRVQG